MTVSQSRNDVECPSEQHEVGDQQKRLRRLLRQYRQPNNTQNLWHVGADLVTLVVVMGCGILLWTTYRDGRLPAVICFPLVAVTIVLIGAIQHRLAALGHEGSHHMLFRHRWLNELVADWLCMFPLFTTTDHYRSLHLGHHRWVNDLERDPEFLNLGRTRRLHEFPMNRWQFVTQFISRILWPISLLRYTWDNMLHGTIGITQRGAQDWRPFRPLFIAGVVQFLAMAVSLRIVATQTASVAWILLSMTAWTALAGIVIWLIPEHHFYRSGYPGCYGPKLRSWMRLTFFVGLHGALVVGTLMSGSDWTWYFRVFWLLPLVTGFPYFMLLRDAYQHANTDEGRYTNSRVMFPDPFSRWAIFMYGSDIHLTHHLHPSVPHYKLRRLHETLKRCSSNYADEVIETHGTFRRSNPEFPCLIETIESAQK